MSAALAYAFPRTPAAAAFRDMIAHSAKVIPLSDYRRPEIPDDFDWNRDGETEDELAARLRPYSDPTLQDHIEADALGADPVFQELASKAGAAQDRKELIESLQRLAKREPEWAREEAEGHGIPWESIAPPADYKPMSRAEAAAFEAKMNEPLPRHTSKYFRPVKYTEVWRDGGWRPIKPAAVVPPSVETPTSDRGAKATDPLVELTHCGGFVGELANWICATAIRPNRVLALASALAVVGTLIGRNVAGPTKSGTHLYLLALARTGAGKQHAINCAKRLLRAAGATDLIGPSDFMSGSAVIDHVENNPLSLSILDEYGAFLKRINSNKASGWETQVSKFFTELWGLNFERYDGGQWARREKRHINAPALSIFGISTPKQFYESLQSGNLPDGFMNRFVVMSSGDKMPEQDPECDGAVPDDMAANVRALFEWRGVKNIGNGNNRTREVVPDIHGWTSSKAKSAYVSFRKSVESRIDKDEGMEWLIGRNVENAVRLATIRAAGRDVGNYDFTVDLSDIEWAISVVTLCGDRLLAEAGDQMVEAPLNHSQAVVRIINAIKESGRISRTKLLRKVQKTVKAKDLDAILGTLEESKTIITEKERPPAGGNPAIHYKIR